MSNLLYLFNPDQDLALASGEVNYMPPASACRMAEELALLPVWFADRLFWKRCSAYFRFPHL